MKEQQIKLIIGSLLHDVGKVVFRAGDGRNHSRSGYEFLKEQVPDISSDILHCVLYHHASSLNGAKLEEDDPAYITYVADNIAAALDRREGLYADDGFDRSMPLSSIFNVLNGNTGNLHYDRIVMDPANGIPYPTDNDMALDPRFYGTIVRQLTDNLKGINLTGDYVNSLLSVLEATMSYIPSSTSRREQADISLYDHVKLTAAVAECLYQYFEATGVTDYRTMCLSEALWMTDAFLLYSMDLSGIQSFLYTISSKGALRGLRARSFYLDMLMEHIVDELLTALSLSRSALIYSGGGHAYILLPNTERAKQAVLEQEERTNTWLMETFGTALFVAGGYVECSPSNLRNDPEGSYSGLFRTVSRLISEKKAHRYTADNIRYLNRGHRHGDRECIICRRMEPLNSEKKCPICAALETLSQQILYQDFFVVVKEARDGALPLPGGMYLISAGEEALRQIMTEDRYVRSYSKNEMYTGTHVATKLWVGNYTTGMTFEELADKSEGIDRIGILRADVDNLGAAFVNGFTRKDGDTRYATLSRTAAFSRQLSMFFKCYINTILEHGESVWLQSAKKRNISIVYSGGDDVFFAGAWNDVVDAFIDLRNAFDRYTQGTLSISGGIGLYQPKYPVNRMANETAGLEDWSKNLDGKNAVTLFDRSGRYTWDTFTGQVLGEKFRVIRDYFSETKEHGMAFLYHIVELLRADGGRFNRARFVYLLSRMEPDDRSEWSLYSQFSEQMYQWAMNQEDRDQLITAIYLYVYLNREKEEA